MNTTPILDRLEQAFNIIAFSSLKEHNIPTTSDNIATESARIERCVEYFYVKDNHVLQYPEYAAKFLTERWSSIVFTDEYQGNWIDDVQHTFDGSSVDEFSIIA